MTSIKPEFAVASSSAEATLVRLLGVGLMLYAVVILSAVVWLFPPADPSHAPLRLGEIVLAADLSPERRFLLLAMLGGALGAFLHVAQSFASFVGKRAFDASWMWWYLLRPFIGAVMSVVVYVVFRSALVPGASGTPANAYGVVGLAVLSGMFSKQAVEKLNEVFTVAFRSAPGPGAAERAAND